MRLLAVQLVAFVLGQGCSNSPSTYGSDLCEGVTCPGGYCVDGTCNPYDATGATSSGAGGAGGAGGVGGAGGIGAPDAGPADAGSE